MESKIETTEKRDLEVDLSIIKSNDRPSLDFTAVCINSSSTFDDSDAVTYTIAYSTSYCYDRENKNLLVTTNSDGTIVKYVYGNGLIASYETVADTTEYQSYSYDLRGSVTSVSDENGTVTAEYTYLTYGERTVIEGKASILGYCARDGVLTETNGLIYMRARYYSTELMRFINEDIITGDISNSNSLNRYAYVQGNPATMIDPFGLEAARAARINNTVDGIYNTTKGAVLMGGGVELMKAGGIVVAAGGPAGWIIGGIMFIAGGVMFIAGNSDFYEGTQQVYYAIENVDGYAYNPVRDDLFGGDKIAYESLEFGLPSIGYGAAYLGSICVSNNATTSSIAANAHYDNSVKTDYYVKPNGDVVPATGYRYMDSGRSSEAFTTGEQYTTYIGFNRYDSATVVKDKFQIADTWSDCQVCGELDTLQVIDSLYIPTTLGNSTTTPEPLTVSYPQYGTGGEYQMRVDDVVRFRNVYSIGR